MGFFARKERKPTDDAPSQGLINHAPPRTNGSAYGIQTITPEKSTPLSLRSEESLPLELAFNSRELRDNELYSAINDKLSDAITLIDEDIYTGTEKDLVIDFTPPSSSDIDLTKNLNSSKLDKSLTNKIKSKSQQESKQQIQRDQNRSINILTKVSHYSNSRLPSDLPPLRVYMPTWPLLCLAAQYSSSAYQQPSIPSDQATYIPADPRSGTKAMVLKGVCCDDRKTIVFAIRGTSTFSLKDWSTNLMHKPTAPVDFLDDQGNLCHSGFLRVAKAMVRPIALRLRTLLEQNPSRTACSLLITGHSAGGAVASLIYAHMLSLTLESELTILTSCFKRVHCVTFGAPPISLLPLTKPVGSEARLKKCLFHSIINEGDPVVRAEMSYVKSLIDLLMTQLPKQQSQKAHAIATAASSKLETSIMPKFRHAKDRIAQATMTSPGSPTWSLPPSTLSNAGRLVVLRVAPTHEQPSNSTTNQIALANQTSEVLRREFETVTASVVTDEQIRQVVYGDPLMHAMEVYRRRIEALSFKAVTGRDHG